MDVKFSALFYSKYSPNSTKLIKLINELTSIFVDIFKIKLICIDNEEIRKRILSSKNIKITYVPCILITYNDGGIEKYEGSDAFEWAESIINRFSTENENEENLEKQNIETEENIIIDEQPPIINQSKKQSNKKPIKQPPKEELTQLEDLEDLEELDEKPVYKNKSKNSNYTSIDDIDTEDENEDDIQDEIQDENNIQNLSNNNSKDKTALMIKKNSLLSLATQMQKSREDFVSKTDNKNKLK